MIKKIVILSVIGVIMSQVFATITYVHIQCNFQYMYKPGQDSALKVKLIFDGLPTHKQDSFELKGSTIFNKNYSFLENWTLHQMIIEFYNAKGQLLGQFRPNYSFNSAVCSGYTFQDAFNGNKCIDFQLQQAGIACAEISYNVVKDNVSDRISSVNGHWSDPLGIYCPYNALNQEPQLVLKSPCSFRYKNDHAKFRWYESPNGISDWKYIASGEQISPAKLSYNGGKMYNQKRWYKMVVDTNWVKGVYGLFESEVFGPVRFYLGMELDSLVIYQPTDCNKRTDLNVYYFADSNTQKLNAPRVWVFYKEHDSLPEKRWFIGVLNSSSTSLAGKKIIPENGYPIPPDSLVLNPGMYRVRYDFTPWNGFDCKLESKSIFLTKSETKYFQIKVAEIGKIKCFGDKTGKLSINAFGNDADSLFVFSELDQKDHPMPFQYSNMGSGSYGFKFQNNRGCIVRDTYTISQPEAYHTPVELDTVLCLNQQLTMNINNKNCRQYLWLLNGDTIAKSDTITLNTAGKYRIYWTNDSACTDSGYCKLTRKNIQVAHDFLVPTVARITDTVYAVNISQPPPDSCYWVFDKKEVSSFQLKTFTLGSTFVDTGYYNLKLYSHYSGCGFNSVKTIRIVGNNDSSKPTKNLGYKGPLIQSFTIDPNPNDGWNYTLKIQLRDTFNVSIYKIDPVSGDIIGDIDLYKKKYYESKAFASEFATAGVFYLKLVAGTENKTIKVVVVK